MSGIYIPGMEMPTEGEYNLTLYVCSDGSAYIDAWSFPEESDKFPVVPIPPHGDLIDRDETVKTLAHDYAYAAADMVRDEMPTIIPAEEG